MRKGGVAADHYTVVALLTCAARNRKVPAEELAALVVHFEAVGITRNIHIGNAMMQAMRTLRYVGPEDRFARMEAEVALLRQRGVRLNEAAYNTLIAGAWETTQYAKAHSAYACMVSDGVQPSSRTLLILIFICTEEGRRDLMQEYQSLRRTVKELEVHKDEVGPLAEDAYFERFLSR